MGSIVVHTHKACTLGQLPAKACLTWPGAGLFEVGAGQQAHGVFPMTTRLAGHGLSDDYRKRSWNASQQQSETRGGTGDGDWGGQGSLDVDQLANDSCFLIWDSGVVAAGCEEGVLCCT